MILLLNTVTQIATELQFFNSPSYSCIHKDISWWLICRPVKFSENKTEFKLSNFYNERIEIVELKTVYVQPFYVQQIGMLCRSLVFHIHV